MMEPAKRKASYEDLLNAPENMTGEIIDGELFVMPRPSRRHVHAASLLGNEIGPPYQLGRGGGPGGWIIHDEPELDLAENILVPDLAGWRRERLPTSPDEHRFTTAPDWVCEILSPSSARIDKVKKMPAYARHGVSYAWLIDPLAKTLDVYRLEVAHWVLLGSNGEDDKVRAEPFQEIEIELVNSWLEK